MSIDGADYEVIGAVEIRQGDLSDLDEDRQIDLMREWFLQNYEDPAQSLPYESRKGGYIWIDGGPYDPHDELYRKFGEFVPEGLIATLANELLDLCPEWAAQVDPPDEEF